METPSDRKPLRFLWCEIRTPPVGAKARWEMGRALQRLQEGDTLSMPLSRPMRSIGRRCHELRIDDDERKITWRVVYRADADAILVAEVFGKRTQKTPQQEIELCKRRFAAYDRIKKGETK
ncbi:MAG: type II toxin-antitoxin system RelE/ParE family toxin [Kiritimatiellae bacterium]|nr:type II toxin-antitoxin system RelE/ParE family toxin [Kiritimatiellia bacterium]